MLILWYNEGRENGGDKEDDSPEISGEPEFLRKRSRKQEEGDEENKGEVVCCCNIGLSRRKKTPNFVPWDIYKRGVSCLVMSCHQQPTDKVPYRVRLWFSLYWSSMRLLDHSGPFLGRTHLLIASDLSEGSIWWLRMGDLLASRMKDVVAGHWVIIQTV